MDNDVTESVLHHPKYALYIIKLSHQPLTVKGAYMRYVLLKYQIKKLNGNKYRYALIEDQINVIL